MTDLELFGHPDSGHACKVALALALSLAGLDWRPAWVDIWAPPDSRPAAFLAASSAAEVPVLMIDGVAHAQSGAILIEIASRFRTLGGESAAGLRRGREVVLWEANRIGMCLPQLKEARRLGGAHFDPAVIDWLEGRFAVDRARFDRMLNGADFLHGAAPGIGDCAVWGYVQWLTEAGVSPSPAMAGWIERMGALPAARAPEAFFPQA